MLRITWQILVAVGLQLGGATGLYAGINASKAHVVERMLEMYHGSPRPFDDSLCTDVLHDYLETLDPEHMYFAAGDIEKIKANTDIKAGLEGKDPDFLNTVIDLYRRRLMWTDTVVKGILQNSFDFSNNDSLVFGKENSPYAADNKELKKLWYKLLKYETLYRITDVVLYDSTVTRDSMLRSQQKEEKVVLKIEERRINKILNYPGGYENYMLDLFCNAITGAYDPHSDFFSPTEKENFLGAVTSEGFAFGFTLDENDRHEVEITHLTPGSPAWKCGKLDKHDVLLQMQWEGEPAIDLAGADADEATDLLSSDNHRLLNLTVRKPNGRSVTVPLRKEKALDQEDYVKSYILNGDIKIGYIRLPDFYTEWGDTVNSNNCANDVAREVLKLKNEGINGLILDLRNNGGGSMEDAMALAGIFIDEGTLGFSKERNAHPHPLKDPNRGTLYDGPMIVMANAQSASASEFVVGALQDYNRAIFVGSPTFGKATSQVVLPCDTTLTNEKALYAAMSNRRMDFVKVTVDKLYRPTGRSNQLNGAQPDIPLPDPIDVLVPRESTYRHALPADTVKRALNFNPLPPLPIKELAEKSKDRVNASHSFDLATQSAKIYRAMSNMEETGVPLNFGRFLDITEKYGVGAEKMMHDLEQDSVRNFKAENYGADKSRVGLESYEAEVNAHVLSTIMHDIYINESYFVLSDLIKLSHR